VDRYAASKIAAENALELLADEDFQVVTLRLAGLHGPPRTGGVVHAMIGAALAGEPIRIHEPATRLSISFLEDVAAMIMALCQLPWRHPSATYNLASPDTPTLLQLAQMIVTMSDSASELVCGDGTARNRVLDVSKLSREMSLTASAVPNRIGEALLHWSEGLYPAK
jgi:nucleoside-diphosphate-sugar epimerase